jgi:hypothetical protein
MSEAVTIAHIAELAGVSVTPASGAFVTDDPTAISYDSVATVMYTGSTDLTFADLQDAPGSGDILIMTNPDADLTIDDDLTMTSISCAGTVTVTGEDKTLTIDDKGILQAAKVIIRHDSGTTPASDIVCGPEQLASGIVLQVFMTGRGTPYGLFAAPVIKVCSRTGLKEAWDDLIDINAGTIAEGKEGLEEVGTRLFNMILDTASGKYKPWAEQYGLGNDLCVFNPAPIT